METIRRKLVRWINDHRKEIVDGRTDTALPPSLDDRQADSWEPLLAIANRAGGVWEGRKAEDGKPASRSWGLSNTTTRRTRNC